MRIFLTLIIALFVISCNDPEELSWSKEQIGSLELELETKEERINELVAKIEEAEQEIERAASSLDDLNRILSDMEAESLKTSKDEIKGHILYLRDCLRQAERELSH